MSRVALLALLACAVAQLGAGPGDAAPELRAPIYYTGRADERLCPSPMCGGIWLKAVNGAAGNCSRPRGQECYVTGLDENHSTLAGLVVSGGLVWGRIVPADIAGFPELRELQVVRAWRPASARPPTGVFRRLVDNRIRCVKAPCYSISAGALNTARGRTVSGVDLRRAGASAEERRWAIDLIERPGLIATGRIVRASDGGRTFVASQIYLPAR